MLKGKNPLVYIIPVAILLCILGYTWSAGLVQGPDDAGASVACRDFVSRQLKAPATAEFADDYEFDGEGDDYTIRSYVDAENSFGARIRTSYTCKVHYTGNNEWSLVDLQVD
jgi:hypothetical protein